MGILFILAAIGQIDVQAEVERLRHQVRMEELLQRYGEPARAFLRRHGKEAAAAALYSSGNTAPELMKFSEAGNLDGLGEPVLWAIHESGEMAARFVMQHADYLRDPVAMECFCSAPGEYTEGFRSLRRDVEAHKARSAGSFGKLAGRWWGVGIGAAVGLAAAVWILRRRRVADVQ